MIYHNSTPLSVGRYDIRNFGPATHEKKVMMCQKLKINSGTFFTENGKNKKIPY
jgi:hypothetical protein